MARARTNHVIPRIIRLLGLIVIFFIASTSSRPYQMLKHKDGYIAVFIRQGDEPLENIDPVLAEAFNEKNIGNGVIPIEHQNIDVDEVSIIDNVKLRETALSNAHENNKSSSPLLVL